MAINLKKVNWLKVGATIIGALPKLQKKVQQFGSASGEEKANIVISEAFDLIEDTPLGKRIKSDPRVKKALADLNSAAVQFQKIVTKVADEVNDTDGN